MTESKVYTVGGTIQTDGGLYVRRAADEQLYRHCLAGDFCYVLTARQLGKSSLMVHTAERLRQDGVKAVQIDLSEIGTDLSLNQWYLGLLDQIDWELGLNSNYVTWWDQHDRLGETHRFSQFWRNIVLPQITEKIVVFVDEIDTTLSLDFPADDFFAAIRAIYNARAKEPAHQRLSFVLLGVARPTDLIKDSLRTPFNIGIQIDLTDFTPQEAQPLVEGLGFDLTIEETNQILDWIINWTHGHPYLTQRLCRRLAENASSPEEESDIINALDELFFTAANPDHNLRFVSNMLTREPYREKMLTLYADIWSGQPVADDESTFEKQYLKQLAGIVRGEKGQLVVSNRIYYYAFNDQWISEALGYQPGILNSSEAAGVDEMSLENSTRDDLAEQRHDRPSDNSAAIFSQSLSQKLAKMIIRPKTSLDALLAQADLNVTSIELITIQIALGLAGIATAWTLFGGIIISLIFCAAFFILPIISLFAARNQRLYAFENQISDAIRLVANGLRAGYSLLQAVDVVSRELSPPVSDEFKRVINGIRKGQTYDEVFQKFVERVPSFNLELLVKAIETQREVGGNLAEILETIGFVISERIRIARNILGDVKTNYPFRVLFLITVTLGVFQEGIVTVYFEPAVRSVAGRVILSYAYILLTIGIIISCNATRLLNTMTREELGWHGNATRPLIDFLIGIVALLIVLLVSRSPVFSIWILIIMGLRFLAKSRLIFILLAAVSLLIFLSVGNVLEQIALLQTYSQQNVSIDPLLETANNLAVGFLLFFTLSGLAILLWLILMVLLKNKPVRGSTVTQSRSAEVLATKKTTHDPKESRLSQPFFNRVLVPLFATVTSALARLSPGNIHKHTQQELNLAGNPYGLTSSQFTTLRLFAAVTLAAFAAIFIVFLGYGPRVAVLATAGGFLVGLVAPNLWLQAKIRNRQEKIQRTFPDVLDLLTITVEAGLGLDAAMQRVSETWDNIIAEEFGTVTKKMRLGIPRREALRSMEKSIGVPELTNFVAAIIQAEQLGVSIAKILRVQSEQLRIHRQQRMEAAYNKLNSIQEVTMSVVLSIAVPLWLLAPVIPLLFY